ncbi:MAG: peptidylprolyl isomerase [Saprospiraceae bacterium]|nr:peptidylprolyl isomerase [Saprospiraceae bacterium]MCB9343961.1 peptidylprolyl isomerase [Lewinellaceae bacterium]
MALIGTIRKNGWILIVTMVLALGGFILMDIISNSQRYSAADVNNLGTVGGREIKRNEFENYQQLIYSQNAAQNPYQIRLQVWDYFVQEAVVTKEAEAIGLGVCKDELMDLQFGTNISPVIAERFKGNDGRPNMQMLASVKAGIEDGKFNDPTNRAYWAVQEKEVIKKRLEDKIVAMASKSVYTPAWQAEMVFKESNQRLDFQYVAIPFDRVKEGEAPVTDADYEAFLSKNPHLYDQTEESRIIAYTEFVVIPTSADTAASREQVAKLVQGFKDTKSDSSFIISNNGTMEREYRTKAQLSPVVADSLLSKSVGSVVGPYLDQDEWKIAKVLDRKALPDSVKARHILIRDPQNPASKTRSDSLLAIIKGGTVSFDSIAIKNSQDPGSGAKGGDLGWFGLGQMVPEFNEVCFYTGNQGEYYQVATQFGWHIIQITGKKFINNEIGVKVAYVNRRVEPSKTTQQAAKDKAIAAIQKAKSLTELTSLGGQEGFLVQNSPLVKENDFSLGAAGTGEDARSVIRWAFEENTKVGNVSPEVFVFRDPKGGFFDSKYLVAALKSVIPEGKANVATLKNLPEADTKVKNLKKAEYIKSKINSSDFNALATQWNARVDTVKNVSFQQSQGGEPAIQGVAFGITAGQVSKPIIGNGGVYVLSPITEPTQAQVPSDLTLFRRQIASSAMVSYRTNLLKSMIKKADKADNRSRFY